MSHRRDCRFVLSRRTGCVPRTDKRVTARRLPIEALVEGVTIAAVGNWRARPDDRHFLDDASTAEAMRLDRSRRCCGSILSSHPTDGARRVQPLGAGMPGSTVSATDGKAHSALAADFRLWMEALIARPRRSPHRLQT